VEVWTRIILSFTLYTDDFAIAGAPRDSRIFVSVDDSHLPTALPHIGSFLPFPRGFSVPTMQPQRSTRLNSDINAQHLKTLAINAIIRLGFGLHWCLHPIYPLPHLIFLIKFISISEFVFLHRIDVMFDVLYSYYCYFCTYNSDIDEECVSYYTTLVCTYCV